MTSYRIHIDAEKCVAAGQCVMVADDIFDQDEDDGIVILLKDEVDEARIAAVRKAAKLCPAVAIWVEEV